MKTNICKNCNKEFDPCGYIYKGRKLNSPKRKFCYSCSPAYRRFSFPARSSSSKIYQMSSEDFNKLVKSSESRASILRKINMRPTGSSTKSLNERIFRDNIDISHFKSPSQCRIMPKFSIPYEEIMIENSSYSTCHLKNRIIKDKILINKCSWCGIYDIYNEKPITLQLDHINGVSNDHRMENLRLLCPNCHSQTKTYGGKRNKIKVKIPKVKKPRPTKISWPSIEEIVKQIKIFNIFQLSKKLGVSDNAIRDHLKRKGVCPKTLELIVATQEICL